MRILDAFASKSTVSSEAAVSARRASPELGVAELVALSRVEVLTVAEVGDETVFGPERLLPPPACDHLRLAAPRLRAESGDALFRRVSGAIDRFSKTAPEASPRAEIEMMKLVRSVRDLQAEIHSRRDQSRFV